ncbi:hypothetical protein [Leptospira sp. 'Mane']|uniref:hypothetical protein n=1 Tax=Leptospira sp. 'Mane' TaxID=3387407 RepID=UPI00398B96E7
MNINLELIGIFSTILSSIAIFLFIIQTMIKNRNEKLYDYQRQRALINLYRENYENRIYNLEEKLMSNPKRWKDTNHLLISSNNFQINNSNLIHLNSFLKSAGITESDLKLDKKSVFMLTPYNSKYSEVYEIVNNVCSSVGLKCSRGDEEFFQSDFLTHILKLIIKSPIIIANIDGRSPNVYYELGIAHALGKKTILISKTIDDIPADIKSKRILIYKSDKALSKSLRDEIIKILSESN